MSVLSEKDIIVTLGDAYTIYVEFSGGLEDAEKYVNGLKRYEVYTGPDESYIDSNIGSIRHMINKRISQLEEFGKDYARIKEIMIDTIDLEQLTEGMWRVREDTDLNTGDFLGVMVELWSVAPRMQQLAYVYLEKNK